MVLYFWMIFYFGVFVGDIVFGWLLDRLVYFVYIFRNFDNVVGNLVRNFVEGIEYFKVSKCYLLFDLFFFFNLYVI